MNNMFNFNLAQRFLLSGALLFGSPVVMAQTSDDRENYLSGSIYVRLMSVDNATGVANEDEQIDETQTEFGAFIESEWQSELAALALSYQANETRYSEDSQDEQTNWEGDSSFKIGNATTFYGLDVNHSIRRVLREPDAAAIVIANTEEREIYGVAPTLKTRIGSANAMELRYEYSEVSFDNAENNDSERNSVDLFIRRLISPMRELSLVIGESEIDYSNSDDTDYTTQLVAIRLDVEHRVFDYSILLGVTKIDPEQGDSENSTTVDFALNSEVAGNLFTLFANRSVSDTSFGNGNNRFFNTESTFNSNLDIRDQIEITSAGVGWTNDGICGRCLLDLSVGLERLGYVNFPINDSRQTFASVNFGYRVSRDLTASVAGRFRKSTFEEGAQQEDTDNNVLSVDVSYRVNPLLDLSIAYEEEEVEPEVRDSYVVRTARMTATLNFD